MIRNLINRSYVCTVLLTLIFSILMFTLAEADTHYKVRKGDNLAKISKKFSVPGEQLKASNNLQSNDLSIGKKLVIPKKASAKYELHKGAAKSEKVAKAGTSETSEQPSKVNDKQSTAGKETEAPTALGRKYHTVQKKDTIFKIARKYGLSVAQLKELNDLSSNKLKTGRKLIVGKSSGTDDQAKNKPVQSKHVNVSEKIAEVKALSQSDELSNLSVNERLILFAKKMINLPYN